MKKLFFIATLAALISSCAPSSPSGSNGGELVGVRAMAWGEPTPYGMVLVERGSFTVGSSEEDSIWGTPKNDKPISVESFWMDETEITNGKYKQFLYWVRDSIIRERLADPAYGGNEAFKIEEDREGNPVAKPYLNWTKAIPWKNPTEDEARAIESVYRTNPITGQKELDPTQMNYRYEIFNHTEAAKRRNRLDPTRRVLNTDIKPNLEEEIIISKDTAFINDDGKIITETIVRPLSSEFDFLNTYIVNIYPDTTAWVNDFDNAYNEPYMRLYFSHPGYNDYPVVGVSWEQATAFCAWRTQYLISSLQTPFIEPYRLPTEAEWEYAARAGMNENKYPWGGDIPMTEKGCFNANFKPQEGNYVKDGNLITSNVATYPPNDFGLYDMAGNVSEWTSTAYSEGGMAYTSDMNPDYQYNAAKEDPYQMKRKIIRGGSWKDVSNFIRSDMRMWEYQNEQRSYIGFRCVRTQVGFAKGRK